MQGQFTPGILPIHSSCVVALKQSILFPKVSIDLFKSANIVCFMYGIYNLEYDLVHKKEHECVGANKYGQICTNYSSTATYPRVCS